MCRFLKAELFKLYKNKTFKVLCVVALILAVIGFGMIKLMSSKQFWDNSLKSMPKAQRTQMIQQLKNSYNNDSKVVVGKLGFAFQGKDMFKPTTKGMFHSSFGSGVIEILLVVLIGAMVAAEYSSGTIKNMLAYGRRREYYYVSKLIAITIGAVILMAIMVTVPTIISAAMLPWGSTFGLSQVMHIITVFVCAAIEIMAIVSVIMLLATLLRSKGNTIGIGIVVFAILPTIISLLYGKFGWFDKLYELTPSYNWGLITSIKANNGDMVKAVSIAIVTLIISSLVGIMILKKQDIK